jgi:hypothetical protein
LKPAQAGLVFVRAIIIKEMFFAEILNSKGRTVN